MNEEVPSMYYRPASDTEVTVLKSLGVHIKQIGTCGGIYCFDMDREGKKVGIYIDKQRVLLWDRHGTVIPMTVRTLIQVQQSACLQFAVYIINRIGSYNTELLQNLWNAGERLHQYYPVFETRREALTYIQRLPRGKVSKQLLREVKKHKSLEGNTVYVWEALLRLSQLPRWTMVYFFKFDQLQEHGPLCERVMEKHMSCLPIVSQNAETISIVMRKVDHPLMDKPLERCDHFVMEDNIVINMQDPFMKEKRLIVGKFNITSALLKRSEAVNKVILLRQSRYMTMWKYYLTISRATIYEPVKQQKICHVRPNIQPSMFTEVPVHVKNPCSRKDFLWQTVMNSVEQNELVHIRAELGGAAERSMAIYNTIKELKHTLRTAIHGALPDTRPGCRILSRLQDALLDESKVYLQKISSIRSILSV